MSISEHETSTYQIAIRDFRRARRKAALRQVLARLTGKSADLLSYNEVREQLPVTETVKRGLQEVPLDAIVGSVGRYQDFTRDFLPKRDSNEERWAHVKAAVMEMEGWLPIELYKVGEAYFVKDGNHRVSVARQLGMSAISAYVTEVETKVPLRLQDDPTEIICKARYGRFLEETKLHESRPQADLEMTFCGQYHVLLAEIEAHGHILQRQRQEALPYREQVVSWYDEVYLPVVQIIREQGILRDFPQRTEADIYVLLSEHRAELAQALGWEIDAATAVADLADHFDRRPHRVVARAGEKLLDAVIPDELEAGPPPGQWRKERLALRSKKRLFANILVALPEEEEEWWPLEQAIVVAQREDSRLFGLHVVARQRDRELPLAQRMQATFAQRCRQADVPAELAIEAGDVAQTIIKRAIWTDLVVTGLSHPPARGPLARLGAGVNRLVQRSPRPILAVPHEISAVDRGLLAYDGSPKADEALFVAAYLAVRWSLSLAVVTVETEYTTTAALERAQLYLQEHGVEAEYVLRQKPIATAVLETAATYHSNLLIMGGFGFRPIMHLVLGSTVDHILRRFHHPILICR